MPSYLRSKIHSGPVNRSWVSVAAIGSSHSGKDISPRNGFYLTEQGVGFQPAALGSFLKSVVVTYCRVKYCGSSTLVVTVSHWSPFGIVLRSYHSVTTALVL